MNSKTSYVLHVMCKNALRLKIKWWHRFINKLTGLEQINWSRVTLYDSYESIVKRFQPNDLKVLEISGNYFEKFEFRDYKSIYYPEFDICQDTLDETFDFIVAEQVFEHLLFPYRAGKNVFEMLNVNGYFLISTPFLVKIHKLPTDCSRWTEVGLQHFLVECGFRLEDIETFSWGNSACVIANFEDWTPYRRRIHTLENNPDLPYHVWALAKKSSR